MNLWHHLLWNGSLWHGVAIVGRVLAFAGAVGFFISVVRYTLDYRNRDR